MNKDDTQTVLDLTHFLEKLLTYAEHLPPDLVAMLSDYHDGFKGSPPARWNGVGEHTQAAAIARRIAQSLTDHEPEVTNCPGDPTRNRHAWAQYPTTFNRALQILAAQGELAIKDGTYQAKASP